VPAYLERARTKGDVEILAVADICAERRALAAELLPQARIYTAAEDLIENEAEALDFVDISTPPVDHARLAKLALEKGLHVLCEKPLTTSTEEAREILDAAVHRQRVLYPCHNYKHAPVVKAIRDIIASGRIGEVRSLTLNTFRNTHAKGVPEWRTHWRRDKRFSGGGIAMDHGSHTFYLTFDWLGGYPTAVTAKMSNLEPDKYDTEDNFSASLTFPSGSANVHLTWTAGVRKVIYTVQGTGGAITVDDDDMQVAVMKRTSGPDVAQGAVTWEVEKRSIASHWMDASHVQWFNSLFDGFRTAIERGEYVGKEAREAYLCVQLIETAYRSAAEASRELPLATDVPSPAPNR
jgi:predicted dehydrogenase